MSECERKKKKKKNFQNFHKIFTKFQELFKKRNFRKKTEDRRQKQ